MESLPCSLVHLQEYLFGLTELYQEDSKVLNMDDKDDLKNQNFDCCMCSGFFKALLKVDSLLPYSHNFAPVVQSPNHLLYKTTGRLRELGRLTKVSHSQNYSAPG